MAQAQFSRRHFLTGLGGLMGLSMFSACRELNKPLTIVNQVWPGFELMHFAQQQGWLSTDKIKLIKKKSGKEVVDALHSGIADGAAMTLNEVLHQRANGMPLTVILVFDESVGGDALMVRSGINQLADLAGKRIGIENNVLGQLMLHKILEAGNLQEADVDIIDISHNRHLEAWRSGEIDGLITYEPVIVQLKGFDAKNLFDSRQIPGLVIDVLAVKPEAAGRYQNSLKSLIAGHFKALYQLNANPQDVAYRLAGSMGLTGEEVIAIFRGLVFPDSNANALYLSTQNGRVLDSAKQLSSLMLEKGLIRRQESFTSLVDSRFLPTS